MTSESTADEQRQALLAYLEDLDRADPTPDLIKQRAARRVTRIRAIVEA